MREEKFVCPKCDFVDFEARECPDCGGNLEKIKGDDYAFYGDDVENENTPIATVEVMDDDPDNINWYKEDEGYAI